MGTLTLVRFNSASAYFTPTPFNSSVGCFILYAVITAPFYHRLKGAIHFNIPYGTSVLRLRNIVSPSAVFRGIVTGGFYSVYTIAIGSLSHIRYEIFKRISPSLAKCYTFAPIIFKPLPSFIVAPCFNTLPSLVFCADIGPARPYSVPMLSWLPSTIKLITPARLSMSRLEAVCSNVRGSTTVARAFPFSCLLYFWHKLNGSESPELPSSNVNKIPRIFHNISFRLKYRYYIHYNGLSVKGIY